MKAYIEGPGGLPLVKQNQEFRTALPAFFEGNLTVTGTLAAGVESVTSELLTVASANALTVGANGVTNPVLNVDSSASNVATGLNVAGAAAGSGTAISALSSGTNEALTINAKGSGGITLANISTGAITAGQSIQGVVGTGGNVTYGFTGHVNYGMYYNTSVGATLVGNGSDVLGVGSTGTIMPSAMTSKWTSGALSASIDTGLSRAAAATLAFGNGTQGDTSGTLQAAKFVAPGTVTAGGSLSNSVQIGTSGPLVYSGSGVPTISAAVQGSLYLRTDGSSTSTRLYVATNTSGTWTAVTTAA